MTNDNHEIFKQNGLQMDIDREQFAMQLKTWRLRHGLTQAQAGVRLGGCSRFTIIKAEGAKPITWEQAYKLFAKLSDELIKEAKGGEQ